LAEVPRPPPLPRAFALVPAGLGAVLLTFTLVFAWLSRREKAEAELWPTLPTTEGRVVSVEVVAKRRSGESWDEDYRVTHLAWTVDGHAYESTSQEYLGYAGKPHGAPKYLAGQTVTMRYRPESPQSAGIDEPRGPGHGTLFLALGTVTTILSLPFFWLALRFARKPAPST
jgi:hypothetical protein